MLRRSGIRVGVDEEGISSVIKEADQARDPISPSASTGVRPSTRVEGIGGDKGKGSQPQNDGICSRITEKSPRGTMNFHRLPL